jgi:Tfp pilus assembly protein PilN
MPFVNLIHEQRVAAERADRKSKLFFLAFVAVMISSAGGFAVISFKNKNVHDEEAALQAQIERAKPLIAQTKANNLLKEGLTPRLSTLEDAQGDTTRWNRVLTYLTTQTPPQAWLTSLRCQSADPKKPVQITFQGVAMSQEPVGETILRLQNSPDLGNVQLSYTQEKLIQQTKTTEFQVNADLVGTAPKKTLEEEKPQ